jgi:drug/metabolite transporter (DMT)-like permease
MCRLALRAAAIDPATFTTIRVAAGAGMLLLVSAWTRSGPAETPSWASAAILAAYAVPFSFAYTRLSVGTGALILFGAVQITMLTSALRSGEHVRLAQWIGVALAVAGLIYLVFPGLTAPPPFSAGLMALAGVCWGVYSLRGRRMSNPLGQTTMNFIRAAPFVLAISAAAAAQFHVTKAGVVLAVLSGAVTSGLGYVAWYAALRGLTATRAAVLQLAVPVLAALAGVVVLTEPLSTRLIVSSVVVIGGIALTLAR